MRMIYCFITAALCVGTIPTAQANGVNAPRRTTALTRCLRCPKCDHACELSVEKDDESRHTYEVECKPICIPRITFPWQQKRCCGSCGAKGGKDGCCAANNGARAKTVRVLKKYEYECKHCKYKWTPVPKGSGGKKVTKRIEFGPKDDVPPLPLANGMIYGRPFVNRMASHTE